MIDVPHIFLGFEEAVKEALRRFAVKLPNNGCWEWLGYKKSGYGFAYFNHKGFFMHRLSYEVNRGPIPKGLNVCHTCDNPCCTNPDHLFLGTQRDNVIDMIAKGRAKAPPKKKTKIIPGMLQEGGNR